MIYSGRLHQSYKSKLTIFSSHLSIVFPQLQNTIYPIVSNKVYSVSKRVHSEHTPRKLAKHKKTHHVIKYIREWHFLALKRTTSLRYMSRKSEFLSSSVVCFQCKIVSNRILVKECNVYQLFYCVFQSSSVTQIHEFQSLSVIRKKCIPVKKLCQV